MRTPEGPKILTHDDISSMSSASTHHLSWPGNAAYYCRISGRTYRLFTKIQIIMSSKSFALSLPSSFNSMVSLSDRMWILHELWDESGIQILAKGCRVLFWYSPFISATNLGGPCLCELRNDSCEVNFDGQLVAHVVSQIVDRKKSKNGMIKILNLL
jgi:hypothetical protein